VRTAVALGVLLASCALTAPGFLAGSDAVHAATITVGAAEETASIQPALEKARAGDIVQIREGLYVESLRVPDVGVEAAPLTIRAAPGARVVLDAHGAEYGIRIAPGAGWVTVENLTVVRARSFGFYARPAQDLIVRGCTFARNGADGLYAREIDGMTVERCCFHHNRVNGASFRGVTGVTVSDCVSYLHPAAPGSSENFGIYVSGSEGGVFERNALFLNDKSGLRIVESPNGNIVRDNVAYANGWLGIEIKARSRKHLYVNNLTAWNMVHGINLKNYTGDPRYTREIRVINNTMFGNRGSSICVNDGAHDNFFRNNLLVDSPWGFTYDTRVGWDRRNSDHNAFGCDKPIAQLGTIEEARELGLEPHSIIRTVQFASNDPFDFRLRDDSPLHEAATDAGFGKVMGAPQPTWRGPRMLPVALKVTGASNNLEEAKLTTDGSVHTTWNSGVTEDAWIEYEILGELPGPLAFAIICPTVSTSLQGGDLPGPFTLRVGDRDRQVLYDGELFIRQSGLARARGQCFELTRQARAQRVRLELHKAVDGNYNGQMENICLTEVMLIAALDPLPESLAEFPYDEVAPVPLAALEAARATALRPVAEVPDAAAAEDAGLLLYVPFEDTRTAAYARGDAAITCEGAEHMPGIAGKAIYLPALPGNTCSLAAPGNLSPEAGSFSVFLKPLVPWNTTTIGSQNYQFITIAYQADSKWRPVGGDELRLAYVSGAFQVVGGVAYNGPAEFIIRRPMELAAQRWYHLCLTWSKTSNETVLYLDGEEIGRARFGADFTGRDRISLACYSHGLQAMAAVDEVKIFDRALTPERVRALASWPSE